MCLFLRNKGVGSQLSSALSSWACLCTQIFFTRSEKFYRTMYIPPSLVFFCNFINVTILLMYTLVVKLYNWHSTPMFLRRRLGDDLASERFPNLGVGVTLYSPRMASPWHDWRRLVVESAQADAARGGKSSARGRNLWRGKETRETAVPKRGKQSAAWRRPLAKVPSSSLRPQRKEDREARGRGKNARARLT